MNIQGIFIYLTVAVSVFAISGIFELLPSMFILICGCYFMCKKMTENEIQEALGIIWLQKKFNNNKVIMDMTNE